MVDAALAEQCYRLLGGGELVARDRGRRHQIARQRLLRIVTEESVHKVDLGYEPDHAIALVDHRGPAEPLRDERCGDLGQRGVRADRHYTLRHDVSGVDPHRTALTA